MGRLDTSADEFGIFGRSGDRLRAALEASCVVGTWDWDHIRGVVVYDTGAAQLLTGNPDLAEKEIKGLIAIAAVHPADHAWLIEHMAQAIRTGGLILAEYRIVAENGDIRWLLSRGRTYQTEFGHPLRSCGILIDITEMRDGGERYVVSGSEAGDAPLDRAADLAIALKQTLGPDAPTSVQAATEMLLISLGQALARAGRH